MKKYNLLIGVTGSVASILTPKIVEKFQEKYNVILVCTESSLNFFDKMDISLPTIYLDSDEWNFSKDNWQKNDKILHIELRNWADAILIAPLSMNTLGKIANGLCDNLLTSIVRAWDYKIKPMFLAPCGNTYMYENPITKKQLSLVEETYGAKIIAPVEKMLACKSFGVGALPEIEDLYKFVNDEMDWKIPVNNCRGIPIKNHPGSFGYKRSYYLHTGIDLYCQDGDPVYACEKGIVVNIEDFTGPKLGHTWWESTNSVLVRGKSGVICYGELTPSIYANKGFTVNKGQLLGYVKRVLPFGKERPDIPGHSLSMLHLELYDFETKESVSWHHGDEKPKNLLDPTEYLLNICDKTLEM